MSEALQERITDEYAQALNDTTAADLAALIKYIEHFGVGHELDAIIHTARPGARVQRRFLPVHTQGDIFKAALRTAKAQDLVQDVVVGLYADELGDDVADPSLAQLQSATDVVLGLVARGLVIITLLGVVYRDEVAKPHAIEVLKNSFGIDLTK